MTTETVDGFYISDEGVDSGSQKGLVAVVRESDDYYMEMHILDAYMNLWKRDPAAGRCIHDLIETLGSAPQSAMSN
jgi:hypothetical protein